MTRRSVSLSLCLLALASFAVLVFATASRGRARAATANNKALVRVDQLGYASSSTKRAYLIATAPESGAAFTVVSSAGGAPVFTGVVGRSLGPWSARWRYVYALDFDAVAAPDRYVVQVSGRLPAASPAFPVDVPATLYRGGLHNALTFYQDERDGPDFIRSPLRTAPGHLNDQHALTYLTPKVDGDGAFAGDLSPLGTEINAAGGWWDAGDYLKFVQTASYTTALMLTGVRDFPAEMGASAPTADFVDEARFGVQWLLRMWDDNTRTLYYQVGIGDGNDQTVSDHDVWRLPQADDRYAGNDPRFRYIRRRPVFRAAPPGSPVSPNLAGRDAAAFGLCFQVYRQTDPALADRCLRAGEDIFALADTAPKGPLLTVIPFDFYPETEWRDDLEFGAVELADALVAGGAPSGLPHTSGLYYLHQAARWAQAYTDHTGGSSDPLNLYDTSGLAHYELYRAIGRFGDPSGLAVGRPALLADLRRELLSARKTGGADPFGFGFPWNVADTASHGFGLSVMASEYASLTGDPAYRSLAVRWLGNVLGANAWGASLVIGDGTTFPDCPQHQVANLVGSLTGGARVLAGAVVEGPSDAATTGLLTNMRRCPPGGGDAFAPFNNRAVFRDNVQSYSTVEPAIDLSASSPLAMAWQESAPRPLGG